MKIVISKSRKRTRILIASLVVLGSVGLVLAFPWWLPAAGRPVARHFGVEWDSVQVRGWHRYQVKHIRGSFGSIEISIDHLQLPGPIPWIGSRFGFISPVTAQAENLAISLHEAEPPAAPLSDSTDSDSEQQGVDILATVLQALDKASPWMPVVHLGHLEVQDQQEHVLLEISALKFAGPLLSGHLPARDRIPSLDWSLLLSRDQLRIAAVPVKTDSSVRLKAVLAPGLPSPSARVWLYSAGQALEARASFKPGLWIPETVQVNGESWPVPGLLFPNSPLNPDGFLADVMLDLQQDTWLAEINLTGKGKLPGSEDNRVTANIKAQGNPKSIEVSAFSINSGWLNANLSDPIQFSLIDKSFSQNAKFKCALDLSKQDWIPATGFLEVSARMSTRSVKRPELGFDLSGSSIDVAGFPLQHIEAVGNLNFPVLNLESVVVDLGNDSRVSLSGSYGIDDQSLLAETAFQLDPKWMEPFVGSVTFLSPLSGSLSTDGNITALRHTGKVEPVDLDMDGLYPITAQFTWQGLAMDTIDLAAQVVSDSGSHVECELTAVRGDHSRHFNLTVRNARHEDPAGHFLELRAPFSIVLDLDKERPVLAVSPLRFDGKDAYLSGEYNGDRELIRIEAENLSLDRFSGWMERTIPSVTIDRLDGSITRLKPHLEARVDLTTHSTDATLQAFNFRLNGKAGTRGMRLDTIDGRIDGESFIFGTVSLPILVHPFRSEKGGYISSIPGMAIEGALTADLSQKQADGLQDIPFLKLLSVSKINLAAGGTVDDPEVQLEASMDRFGILGLFNPDLSEFPMKDLHLSASFNSDQFQIHNFNAHIKGADLRLAGFVPNELIAGCLNSEPGALEAILNKASLDLSIGHLMAKDFRTILPGYLRTSGQIDGKLSIRPGFEMTGYFNARQFSLRPTLFSQTVDNITISVDVEGSRLVISQASAAIGNSLVDIAGFYDLDNFDAPTFALDITGERTPLIRTPDLMLYGDLDLHLNRSDPRQPARISGNLNLRDSILMMDIEPLSARTTGKGLPRLPFFSVDQAPFADWILDVDITGDTFLRFRSAYVKTTLSTVMDLTGTLADPVWVGSIFADEGTVDFPGLRTHMSRSEVFVTRERQESLQLDFSTIGQVASYILTIRISGSLDNPHVQFASTPDLPNSKIIQLLATGSVEGSNFQNFGLYLGKSLFPISAGESVWDRLTIQIGRDITRSSKDTIDLYYDINDWLRVHGEYDKYDAQNLNLEWEVFSK